MSAGFAGLIADTLRRLTAQQMPARHEQIGQRAGHQQAMGVLAQPAIANLGKAEHPLDDPDRVFDPITRLIGVLGRRRRIDDGCVGMIGPVSLSRPRV